MLPVTICNLAEIHIKDFQHKIQLGEAGSKGIRLSECYHYLSIWQNVLAKGGLDLEPDELAEIRDAEMCGEYDDVIGTP